MSKKLLALLLLAFGLAGSAFAEHSSGYLYNIYGDIVKDAYGHCVHTAYYDPADGLAECGEAPSQDANSGS